MPGRDLALLIFICFVWAGNFLAAAWAVESMPPLVFTVVRFLLVLLVLLPFLRRPPKGQWPTLLGVCWSIGALHFALVFAALGRSEDVSSIAITMQIYVPMTTILAVTVLGERVGWRTTTAVTIAFGGVLLVGLDPLVLAQIDALFLVIASAFFLALGTVLMRRLKGIGVFSFQAWNALLSLPLLAIAAWLVDQPDPAQLANIPATAWLAVVYSAIGASIIGHGGFYLLIQRHPVTEVTPYLLLVPILAVGLGVAVWGDRPGWRLAVGGGLVLIGVLWVTLRARIRRRPLVTREVGEAPAA